MNKLWVNTLGSILVGIGFLLFFNMLLFSNHAAQKHIWVLI